MLNFFRSPSFKSTLHSQVPCAEQMIEQKQMEHREAMRKLALQEQKALQRLEEIVDTIQADGPPSRSTSR
ncbi:hypothetical protein Aduo_011267 [Ancylostoma duodenale]